MQRASAPASASARCAACASSRLSALTGGRHSRRIRTPPRSSTSTRVLRTVSFMLPKGSRLSRSVSSGCSLAAPPSIDLPQGFVVDYRPLEAHAVPGELLREREHWPERLHLLCVRQGSPDAHVHQAARFPIDGGEVVEAPGESSNRGDQGLLRRIEPSLDRCVLFGRERTP